MRQSYSDITDRIAEPPKWWDEFGVPRYCDFEPRALGDIYTQEGALLEIACFACRRILHVGYSNYEFEPLKKYGTPLADIIRDLSIAYGDPPAHGNCRDGLGSGCLNLRVLQYWRRGHNAGAWSGDWRRDSSLEIDLPELADLEKR